MMPNQLGKYTLVQQLGKGGFGTVYKATDPIGRTVAIKVLKSNWVDDPEIVARFQREARTAGSLFHPGIATILDFDQVDRQLFLVMRYVEGTPLDTLITNLSPLPWNQAITILKQLALALDYAHQHGFVHRDVKPSNIIVSDKEGAVLTDFGLVKAAETSWQSSAGVILGTPNYIAPEIWNGQSASPVTDVYSLACVFYEMLTGKILFKGDSTPQIITQHIIHGPSFPAVWHPDVPANLVTVLRKALAKEPRERFASAGEFCSALMNLTNPVSPQAVPRSTAQLPLQPTASVAQSVAIKPKRHLWDSLRSRDKTVVFLSSGGTCRDPMAMAIANQLLDAMKPRPAIRFRAAGLGPISGTGASYGARHAIREFYGSDLLKDHKPALLTAELVAEADLILAMDRSLLLTPGKTLPPGKTFLLKEFLGSEGDIIDPWPDGKDAATLERYRVCAEELRALLTQHMDRIIETLKI